ncbi:MAG: hypothetical protein RIM99_07665 [Cyclobacteriaceae bacterium]
MKHLMAFKILAFLLILMIGQACQNASGEKQASTLGTIEFEVTGEPDAAEFFREGVLLLHSFMYSDAAAEFRNAQEKDPDFAMAYWGEAMTHNHPLWSEQNYEKAVEVLLRLGTTSDERINKAGTEFEKDLFRSVEILYGEGSKIERDDAYAEYLASLNEKYPNNHEISAFYALSLLGSVETGRDYAVYEKGARIAKGILSENPGHPGALHYLIHSYDDPDHASLALEAANNYSKVAPDAGHALHMPSHIYIAMGMWDEVISSNIRSYEARLKRVQENKSSNWNLHAYHWLLYGYLQKGDLENARKIMTNMQNYVKSKEANSYTKSYVIDMVGNYWAETNDWNAEVPSIQLETDGLNVRFEASRLFLEGYRAFVNGEVRQLTANIEAIEDKILKASNSLATRGITVCSGVGFASKPPNQDDIDMARVFVTQLKIGQARLSGIPDQEIEELMVAATQLEETISFNFGPPAIVIPTWEMYGNWLLEKERYEDAITQFDKSLEKGPGRMNALKGKLKAASALGDDKLVDELQQQILNNTSGVSNSQS